MSDTNSLQPLAPGDVLVASTVLDDPKDDHAGRGRILQYDANLQPKGTLWLTQTTHLVGGLELDAQGRLWAFDSHDFKVLNIAHDGAVTVRHLPQRAFSHVNFAPDGTFLLGEHVAGSSIKPEIAARMGTKIPFMPGTERFGDGHVFRFREDDTLVKEYATEVHGGMGGFLGVTMSALSPDGSTLVYCSETGPRLMRYDLANDRQLPDLISFPEGQREMFFAMAYDQAGRLLVLRGARIDAVDAEGKTTKSWPLEGFGWAVIELSRDGRHAYAGNFFTGEIAKLDLESGAKVASANVGQARSLAGIAEYLSPPAPRSSRNP